MKGSGGGEETRKKRRDRVLRNQKKRWKNKLPFGTNRLSGFPRENVALDLITSGLREFRNW